MTGEVSGAAPFPTQNFNVKATTKQLSLTGQHPFDGETEVRKGVFPNDKFTEEFSHL